MHQSFGIGVITHLIVLLNFQVFFTKIKFLSLLNLIYFHLKYFLKFIFFFHHNSYLLTLFLFLPFSSLSTFFYAESFSSYLFHLNGDLVNVKTIFYFFLNHREKPLVIIKLIYNSNMKINLYRCTLTLWFGDNMVN